MALPFFDLQNGASGSTEAPGAPAVGTPLVQPSLVDRLHALFSDPSSPSDQASSSDQSSPNDQSSGDPSKGTPVTNGTNRTNGTKGTNGGAASEEGSTSDPIKAKIVAAASKYGVDPALMLSLAFSESGFNPRAVSRTGARGLFQFTSGTAKQYGVDPFDPNSASDGAARYMRDLLQASGGDVTKAIAAYKGVSAGGATMANVTDTIKNAARYRGQNYARGFTAPANPAAASPSDPAAPSGAAPSTNSSPIDLGDRSDLVGRSGLPDLGDRSDLAGGTPPTATETALPTPIASPTATEDSPDFSGVKATTSNTSTPKMGSAAWFDALPLLEAPEPVQPGGQASAQSTPASQMSPAQMSPAQREAAYRSGFDAGQTGPVGGGPENIGDVLDVAHAPGELQDLANAGIKSAVKNVLTLGGTLGNSAVTDIKQTVADVRTVDEKIAHSPFLTAIQGVLRTSPQGTETREAAQLSLAGVDALSGGTASAVLPKTMANLDESTSTGVPIVDEVIKGSTQLASILVAPEAAIPGSFVATGVRTAAGDESPLAGLADAGLNIATLGTYSKLGAVESAVKRVLGGALVGGTSEAAGALVHGEAPSVGSVVGGALTGGLLAGGTHTGGKVVEDHSSIPEAPEPIDLKTKVDNAAHDAATSPLNDVPPPTPAQTEAGNYKKGHVTIQGLDVSIENPQGSARSGTDLNGEPWSVQMKDHYGYIRGTVGSDGDHVDAFVGPNPASDKVYVVDQVTPGADVARNAGRTDPQDVAATGPIFDEHKVILGANSRAEAEAIYKRNYSDNSTNGPASRIGAITEATIPEFKQWLKAGDTTKPFAETTEQSSNEQQSTPTENTSSQPAVGLDGNTARPADERSSAAPDTQPAEAGAPGIAAEGEGAGATDRARNAEAAIPSGGAAPAEGRGGVGRFGTEEAGSEGLERRPIALHATGKETYMKQGDAKVPVRYALVEARDVELSHNPITFAPNPEYAGENQNNYATDEAQQAIVQRGVADTDWDEIHSQTHNATSGPTAIDKFGQAAGGNGRGLIQKGVYATRPEEAKSAAIQNADRFGLDPAVAARMEQPMIVRVQEQEVSRSLASYNDIAAKNLSFTKSRTPVENGVFLAKRLSPENKDTLAQALANVDRLSDVTSSSEKAAPFIKVLRDVGEITGTNVKDFLTGEGTLTGQGRETIEGAVIGQAVPDAQLVDRLPASWRQKLAKNLAPLGSVESTAGWEIHENLKRLVEYNEARNRFEKKGGVKAMYDKQYSLLPESERPPELTQEDHVLLKTLEDPKHAKFNDFLRSYAANARDARAGTLDFSGEPATRARAFAEAAKTLGVPERTGVAGYFDKTKEEDNEYIRNSLGKLSMNLDPELAARLVRRGAGWIADGVHDFVQWSQRAIDEWGERVRGDLQELYDGARAQFEANKLEDLPQGRWQELADLVRKPSEFTTPKQAVGPWSSALQQLEKGLDDWTNEQYANIPDATRREAIFNYLQAGGGHGDLDVGVTEKLQERALNSSEKYKPGYEAAQHLTDEEKAYARSYRERMDENGEQAMKAGVLREMLEDYVRGEYEPNSAGYKQMMAGIQTGRFDTKPAEALHKIYDTSYEAERAGLAPNKDIVRQVALNELHLRQAVLNRKLLTDWSKMKGKDGRPLALLGGSSGTLGEIVPAPKDADGESDSYFLRPNATKKGMDVTGYKTIDHPAARRWMFRGKAEDGANIYLQGDIQFHPDAFGHANAILGRSKLREALPDRYPIVGGKAPGAALLRAQSEIKAIVMQGPFHAANLARKAVTRGINPISARTEDLDFSDGPNGEKNLLVEGMEHGLQLVNSGLVSRTLNKFADRGEGHGSSSLLNQLPIYGPFHEAHVHQLFNKTIPRWMAADFLHNFPRMEQRYQGEVQRGEVTRDELLGMMAAHVNATYGEKNYAYAARNPTLQDVLRLVAIAPKYLESQMERYGQAVRPYGRDQALSLVRGFLIAAGAAQAWNVLFGKDHTVDWSHIMTAHFGNTDYTPRDDVIDGIRAFTDTHSYLYYRLGPLAHAAIALAEERNSYGEKVGTAAAAWDVLKAWQPIPLQGLSRGKEGFLPRVANSLLSSVGITNYPNKSDGERFLDETLPHYRSQSPELTGARKTYLAAVRAGAPQTKLDAIAEQNGFTDKQRRAIASRAKHSDLQTKAGELTARQLADGFDNHFSDAERAELKDIFARKLASANPIYEMDDATKAHYREKYGLESSVRSSPSSTSDQSSSSEPSSFGAQSTSSFGAGSGLLGLP